MYVLSYAGPGSSALSHAARGMAGLPAAQLSDETDGTSQAVSNAADVSKIGRTNFSTSGQTRATARAAGCPSGVAPSGSSRGGPPRVLPALWTEHLTSLRGAVSTRPAAPACHVGGLRDQSILLRTKSSVSRSSK